mgnify:FL=1
MPLEKPNSYDQARLAVMTDPSVRTWVKGAVKDLEARDPIDAADDADLVANLMALRSTEALNQWRNGGDCYSGVQLKRGMSDEDRE